MNKLVWWKPSWTSAEISELARNRNTAKPMHLIVCKVTGDAKSNPKWSLERVCDSRVPYKFLAFIGIHSYRLCQTRFSAF